MAADIHEPGVSSEDSSSKSKDSGGLTPEHQKYLLQRHGTLELDPVPSADPDDPYNWPTWKVRFSERFRQISGCLYLEESHQSDTHRSTMHLRSIHRSRHNSSPGGSGRRVWHLSPTDFLSDI